MKATVSVPIFAALVLAVAPTRADAGYCGAARYSGCVPCSYNQDAGGACCTVTKTRRRVVYDRQQVTCYKTVYDRVCEDRVINVTRYVREKRMKEVNYTVCKPVWETKTRTYTVCKPVWETRQKEICYTV